MPHLCITAPERTSSRGSTPKMSVEQVKRTSEGWVKSSLGFRFVVRTVSKYCGFGADHINLTPWGSEDQRMPISVERNGLFQQKSTFVSDPQINATCAKCTIFLCRRRHYIFGLSVHRVRLSISSSGQIMLVRYLWYERFGVQVRLLISSFSLSQIVFSLLTAFASIMPLYVATFRCH